jgi:cytoskeletal protein CcmA (bactofilin family)
MLKIKGLTAEDIDGFIDEGTEFLGELRFRNVFRVDGRIRGRVVSENTLIVGETGDVEAEIECGVVSIKGRVKGQVRARQKIELLAGSRVSGTLSAPVLAIEEGSFFQGDCDMHGATDEAKPKIAEARPSGGLRPPPRPA